MGKFKWIYFYEAPNAGASCSRGVETGMWDAWGVRDYLQDFPPLRGLLAPWYDRFTSRSLSFLSSVIWYISWNLRRHNWFMVHFPFLSRWNIWTKVTWHIFLMRLVIALISSVSWEYSFQNNLHPVWGIFGKCRPRVCLAEATLW